ncbi:MAG: 30S ribosomal protein S7 [Candidatus Theseobacter exili]|nr:30S ribosomal protein S7 [Candidatus Theseobacter exili]
MSRRRMAVKRPIVPDWKYNSVLVTRFVNCLMLEGKKSKAEAIFYGAMDLIEKKMKEDPLEVFLQAIQNTKPMLEVKSRRVGGATYQVPVEVSTDRGTALAIRWILSSARGKKGVPMGAALVSEIQDAYKKQGAVIKKKEDTHKMAEANRAFAHYRW